MPDEDGRLGRKFWAVKHRTAGSRGWLSPAEVPPLQPWAPTRLYLLFQFPAPTAVKTLLPGKVMLSLTCLWPYLCNKLLCLSLCLEHLLLLCTSASNWAAYKSTQPNRGLTHLWRCPAEEGQWQLLTQLLSICRHGNARENQVIHFACSPPVLLSSDPGLNINLSATKCSQCCPNISVGLNPVVSCLGRWSA